MFSFTRRLSRGRLEHGSPALRSAIWQKTNGFVRLSLAQQIASSDDLRTVSNEYISIHSHSLAMAHSQTLMSLGAIQYKAIELPQTKGVWLLAFGEADVDDLANVNEISSTGHKTGPFFFLKVPRTMSASEFLYVQFFTYPNGPADYWSIEEIH